MSDRRYVRSWFAALFASAICAAVSSYPTKAQDTKSAVDNCMTALTPQERRIYDVVAADMKPGDDLSDAIRDHVRPMVRSGKIDRQTAMNAAQKVGMCLKQNGR